MYPQQKKLYAQNIHTIFHTVNYVQMWTTFNQQLDQLCINLSQYQLKTTDQITHIHSSLCAMDGSDCARVSFSLSVLI